MGVPPHEPWFKDIEKEGKVSGSFIQCSLCHVIVSKKKSRNLSHYGYEKIPGHRDSSSALCPKLPTEIRRLFLRCGGEFPPYNGELDGFLGNCSLTPSADVPGASKHDIPETPRSDSCVGSSLGTPMNSANPLVGSTSASSILMRGIKDTRPMFGSMKQTKQSSIEATFAEADRRELDKLWAKFFYEANIPFSVARNDAFKAAVMKTAGFRKSYAPPSYHDIRTRLLGEVKTELQMKLDSRLSESLRKFGGTLTMDGWSSVTSRPLVNAMLVTQAGELFLGAVDTTGTEKTAAYMSTLILKYIEEVGPENIVQVCTDNASVMLNASRIVLEKYPHIFMQGCATHAMDLLLEDWGKAGWMANTLVMAKKMVKFIKRRQMPIAVFRKHEAKFSLLMPEKTRFASQFIMIDRLLDVKASLEQVVVDPMFTAYASKKTVSARDKLIFSRKVKKVVLSDEFWEQCKRLRDMVSPVVYALREFDGKAPSTGKAWRIMRDLERHVHTLHAPPISLEPLQVATAKEEFYHRKRLMTTDLHGAAALLNPYLLHDRELADDPDLTIACKRVLQKLCPADDYADVVSEFLAFRVRGPPFHDMLEPNNQKLAPHAWWEFEGACAKLLSPIAKRILAQTVSSSACERNWSSYSYVHDKKRNRLLPGRADDLVYIYSNSKLLANDKLTDDGRWYRENLDLEEDQVHENDEEAVEHDSESDDNDIFEFGDEDDDMAFFPSSNDEDAPNVHDAQGDFIGDGVSADDLDDEQPVARLLTQGGMDKSNNIPLVIASGLRLEKETIDVKTTACNTTAGTMSCDPVAENIASSSKDQLPLPCATPRALFQPSTAKVTPTLEKSSIGLVSLSRAKYGSISSDSDVPLGRYLKNANIPRTATGLQHGLGTSKSHKRKSGTVPNVPPKKPKIPVNLPEFDTWHKYGNIQCPENKPKIKQEVPSDYEYDPTGSSGAEVKGDSDYEQSSGPDE